MIKNNIRRESYLKFLNTWKNRDLIKVLSGVRRSGKSTLLAMFQQGWCIKKYAKKKQVEF